VHYTIGDGFKLGCGLLLAGAFGLAVLALVAAITVFLSSLFGMRVPFPFS
jgi:hypothetical protein